MCGTGNVNIFNNLLSKSLLKSFIWVTQHWWLHSFCTHSPRLCALSGSSHGTPQCWGGAVSGGTSLPWWYPAISRIRAEPSSLYPLDITSAADQPLESRQVLPHWTVCHYKTSSWWPPPHLCGCRGPSGENLRTTCSKFFEALDAARTIFVTISLNSTDVFALFSFPSTQS